MTTQLRSTRAGRAAILCAALGAILVPLEGRAQSDAGAMRVLVVDQSDAVVPGTTVDLRSA